jgi:hypothetical protein
MVVHAMSTNAWQQQYKLENIASDGRIGHFVVLIKAASNRQASLL